MRVQSLAVLPDGRLASGGFDGRIRVWPADGKGDPVALENGSTVRSLEVLPGGRLASGDIDGRIRLWPADGKGDPVTLDNGSGVQSLAVLPDDRLASVGIDGRIRLWLVDSDQVLAALCTRAGRNLSRDEWDRYIGSDESWHSSCRVLPSNWRTPDDVASAKGP